MNNYMLVYIRAYMPLCVIHLLMLLLSGNNRFSDTDIIEFIYRVERVATHRTEMMDYIVRHQRLLALVEHQGEVRRFF